MWFQKILPKQWISTDLFSPTSYCILVIEQLLLENIISIFIKENVLFSLSYPMVYCTKIPFKFVEVKALKMLKQMDFGLWGLNFMSRQITGYHKQ